MLVPRADFFGKVTRFLSTENQVGMAAGWEYVVSGDTGTDEADLLDAASQLERQGRYKLVAKPGRAADYLHIHFGRNVRTGTSRKQGSEMLNEDVHIFMDNTRNIFGEPGETITLTIETGPTWLPTNSHLLPLLTYIFETFQPIYAFGADFDLVFDFVRGLDSMGTGFDAETVRLTPWRYYWNSMVFGLGFCSDELTHLLQTPAYSLLELEGPMVWIMDTFGIGNVLAFRHQLETSDSQDTQPRVLVDKAKQKILLDIQLAHEVEVKSYLKLL